MTVHDETDAEDAVEDGVHAGGRGEGGAGEGDECGGEETLEGPVVGAVHPGGGGEGGWVVHGALVDGTTGDVEGI